MTPLTPTQPDPLDERYGRRPPWSARRRTVLALLGVAVLVAVTAAVYAWSRSGPPQVTYTVVGYKAEPGSVRVDFDVDKPDGSAVVCRVVGKDATATVIGSTDVTLPAAGSSVQRTVTVQTRGLAVVGVVDSCAVVAG